MNLADIHLINMCEDIIKLIYDDEALARLADIILQKRIYLSKTQVSDFITVLRQNNDI